MDQYPHNFQGLSDEDRDFGLLQDLERQTAEEIRQQRAHQRVAVKAKVILEPANSSELDGWKVQGITGDVSEGGCRAMFPRPIGVGDVFRMHFEHPEFDIPMLFARCLRCKMIREDAFEAGFRFFTQIRFHQSASTSSHGSEQMLI